MLSIFHVSFACVIKTTCRTTSIQMEISLSTNNRLSMGHLGNPSVHGQKENENREHWGKGGLLRVKLFECKTSLWRYSGLQNQTGCQHARKKAHFAFCSFTLAAVRRQAQTQAMNQSCLLLRRVSPSELKPDRAYVLHLIYSRVKF